MRWQSYLETLVQSPVLLHYEEYCHPMRWQSYLETSILTKFHLHDSWLIATLCGGRVI